MVQAEAIKEFIDRWSDTICNLDIPEQIKICLSMMYVYGFNDACEQISNLNNEDINIARYTWEDLLERPY